MLNKKIVFVAVAGAMLMAACGAPPAAPVATTAPTAAPTEAATATVEPTAEATAEAPASDIVDTAVAAGNFTTLAAALEAAGLVETLKGEGPFTVFAPTDEAFAKLPAGTVDNLLLPENRDQLIAILTYHVVPGRVLAADVVGLTSATSVQGEDIAVAVDGSNVKVNDANVTATDILASNGVIHVIDSVIMPPTMSAGAAVTGTETMTGTTEMTGTMEMTPTATMTATDAITTGNIISTAIAAGNFTTLAAALTAADLVETLQGEGPFTVFAPTDEAFAKLPAGTVEDLLKPENKANLIKVLTYHVVPGRVTAADVANLTAATTVEGQDIAIKVEGGNVMINNATVTTADIMTSNGVIHVIDTVILPPDMQ
jgi:transforming growth factor-beta-induced protein